MQVAVGSYVGTGVQQQISTALTSATGFCFIVGVAASQGVWRPASYPGASAFDLNNVGGGPVANTILSLDATGKFTVGTSTRVNGNGTTYYYLAVGADSSSDFATGSYVGDGTSSQAISLGWASDLVLVNIDGANPTEWACSQLTGAGPFNRSFAGTSFGVTATGFNVGTSTPNLNVLGSTYYYAAFKAAASRFGLIKYTGTGSAHDVNGVLFLPDWVLTQRTSGSASTIFRARGMGSSASYSLQGSSQSGGITDFCQALGGLTVGTNANANNNNSTYVAWCFKALTTETFWTPLYATHIGRADVVTNPDADALYPQWSVVGPGYYLILKNTTTGQTWTLPYRIANGETLTISFDPTQKTVNSSLYGDISSQVLAGSTWWSLAAGDTQIALELGQTLPQSTITLLRVPR